MSSTPKPGTLVRVPQFGTAAEARIIRVSGSVADVKVLDGPNAGRVLPFPLADVEVVPMFETIAEFAFAVEVAAGPATGRLFA